MADPRLQWRQVVQTQPDVSGLLSQVRGGINDAATAAENILGRYQEGSELKAENELIRRIGGLDQDQLRGAFDQGKFADLNLGERGINILNQAMGDRANIRSTNVNSDRTQASIAWGNNADSRANAQEGRTASEFADGVARRDVLRNTAGLGVQADSIGRAIGEGTGVVSNRQPGTFNRVGDHVFGNADPGQGPVNGNTGPIQADANTRLTLARTLQAEAGNQGPEGMLAVGAVIRNRAASGKYGEGINGVIFKRGQFSAWNSKTDYADGEQGQDMTFQPSAEALAAADAVLAGQYEDITGGATHYYNPDISQPVWGGPINNERPVTAQGALTGYQQALVNSGLFTAQEIQAQSDPIRDAIALGQTRATNDQQTFQNDILAGVTEQVSNSSQAVTGAEAENLIRTLLQETGEFTQAEALDAAKKGAALIAESSGLTENLEGGPLSAITTGLIEESAANTVADATRRFEGQDQFRALNDIERYSEDPTTNLETDLGIPNDPESRGDYDSNNLRNYMNKLADKYNVEPAVMAVAMRDAFIRDPGDDGPWWSGDVDFTRNIIENRFDEDKIKETVDQLTPERRAQFDRGKSDLKIIESQLQQNAGQQRQVLARLNKLDINDPKDAQQREQLVERLNQLEKAAAVLSRQKPTEGS